MTNIQKDWGMFSSQANRAMRLKAESLLKKLDKNKEKGHIALLKAFESYFKSYQKSKKTYPEAGDTAVREEIWGFALDEARRHGISYDELDKIWKDFF